METSDSDDDVHQCGRCKELFHSIDAYFVHKKSKSCVKVKSSTKAFIKETESIVPAKSNNETTSLLKNETSQQELPIQNEQKSLAPTSPVGPAKRSRGRGRGKGKAERAGKGRGKAGKLANTNQEELLSLSHDAPGPEELLATVSELPETKSGKQTPGVSFAGKVLGTLIPKSTVNSTKDTAEPFSPPFANVENTLVFDNNEAVDTKLQKGKSVVETSITSALQTGVPHAKQVAETLLNTVCELDSPVSKGSTVSLSEIKREESKPGTKTEHVKETNDKVTDPSSLPVTKKLEDTQQVYGRGWRKAAPKKAWVEDYNGTEASEDDTVKPETHKGVIVIAPVVKKPKETTTVKQPEVVRRKRGRPRKYPIREVVKQRTKQYPSAEGGPWPCPQCEYQGVFRDEFDRHLRREHNLSNWVCQKCGQPFKDKYKLQRHEKAAECKTIQWSGVPMSQFVEFPKKLLRSLEGMPPELAPKEELEGNSDEDVDVKREIKPSPDADFTCYICNEPFDSYEVIMKHLAVHKDIVPGICRFCGKWFRSKYKVWRHMSSSIHDNIKEKDIKQAKKELSALKINWKQDLQSFKYPRTYHCQTCKMVFSTKLLYEKHANRYHGADQSGNGRYKCESCDQLFSKRNKYQNHLFYDHGIDDDSIKNIKCPVCARVFTQKTHVFRHLDTLHTPAQQIPVEEMDKDEVFAQNISGKHDLHRFRCFVCQKLLIGFTVYYRHIYNHRVWVCNTPNGPDPDQQLIKRLYESWQCMNIQSKILLGLQSEKKSLDDTSQAAIQDGQQAGASTSLASIDQPFGDLVQQHSLLSFLQDQLTMSTGMQQEQAVPQNHQGLQVIPQQQLQPLQPQDQSPLQSQSYHELGQPLQPLLESLPQGEKIPTQAVVHHHPKPNQTPNQPLHQQQPQSIQHQHLLSQQHMTLPLQQNPASSPTITTSLNLDTRTTVVHMGPATMNTSTLVASSDKLGHMGAVSNQQVNLAEGLKTALDISHQIVSGPPVPLQSTASLHPEEAMMCGSNDGSQERLDDKKSLCVYCNQNFNSLRALYDHKVNDHNLLSVFCCVKLSCQHIFYKVLDYEAHAKVHPQKCFICYACNFHFEDMNDLVSHKTACHRGLTTSDTHKCSVCHKTFQTKESLTSHLSKGEHHFQCSQCGKVLGSQSLLKDHEAEHLGLENFLCDICGATFNSKAQLNRHRTNNHFGKMHKCTLCDTEFCKREHLKRHLISKHSSDKPFTCQFTDCMKSFKRKDKLQEHYRSHSINKPYECKVCGKSYRYREGLRYHEKTHRKDAKYFCNICHEGFVRPSQLRLHMKNTHEIELKATHSYPCELCTLIFARPERLKRHMEKAHLINAAWKYTCKSCNKGFAGEKSLVTHMKRSHGTAVVKRKPAKSRDEEDKEQPAVAATISEVPFTPIIVQQQQQQQQPQQQGPTLVTIDEIAQQNQQLVNKNATLPIVQYPSVSQPASSVPITVSMTVPALSHQMQVQVPTLIRSVPQVALQPTVTHSMMPSSAALTVTTSAAPMLITHPSLLQPIQITAYQPPNMTVGTQQLRPAILNTSNTINTINTPVVSQNHQLINTTVPMSSSTQPALQLQPVTRMVVSGAQSQGDISVLTAPLTTPLQQVHNPQINSIPFTQLATYAPFNNTFTHNYNQVFQTPLNQSNQLLQQAQQQQQQQQIQLQQQLGTLGSRTQ